MKGVSAILSTALLLGVAVSVAGIYATWAPDIAGNLTRQVTANGQQDIQCRNAAISIQDAVYDLSGEATLFEVRNAGTIRFVKPIQIIALNETFLVNSTNITGLEVEETVSRRLETKNKPERLIATTSECPSIREEENIIGTQP